jgi:hypothetical protein
MMLNRYVCAGIVLLALGGIVRADDAEGAIVKGTITSNSTVDVRMTANKQNKIFVIDQKATTYFENDKKSTFEKFAKAVKNASPKGISGSVKVGKKNQAAEIHYITPVTMQGTIGSIKDDGEFTLFTLDGVPPVKSAISLKIKGAKLFQKVTGTAKETPSSLDALKQAFKDRKTIPASVTFSKSDFTAISITYVVNPPGK